MNIVVCVKQVPDTWAERTLNPTDKTLDRAKVDTVMNEIDEYAVEEAMRIKEANDGSEVTIVTMGPDRAVDTVRKALSMGADKAVHLSDEALHGSCVMQTSEALAKVIGTLEYDLIITGSEATDSRVSVMPALLAERLGIPQLSLARKVTVEPGSKVTIERQTDNGYQVVEAALPAVISVVEKINEPRYPSFKGIMAAKSKPMTILTAADAGLDAGTLGLEHATTQVSEAANRPPRSGGEIVKNEGDGGVKLADFLASQKLI
ncbi:MAG TPA: electron transfer flavoprotein subunit beta/FixA family protein [Mycobacteriales bacterium]